MPKDFLTLADFTPGEAAFLIEETLRLKRNPDCGRPLAGKSIAMIFSKSSTRTRMGFEIGMYQLGGHAMLLRPDEIQLTRGETLADTARVMSRFVDGLVVRTFSHGELEELASHSAIPVINALTDMYHPCQAVADYATLLEKKGSLKNLRLSYIGDGNNVAHSLMIGGALLGVDVTVAGPVKYWPKDEVVRKAEALMAKSGGALLLTDDPTKAAEGADALYTDVWVSMGHEEETAEREEDFDGFMLDEELVALAKPDCCVMHCLPAHRGAEIESSVLDGPRSVVFDQAENKLHAQKAILKTVLGGS